MLAQPDLFDRALAERKNELRRRQDSFVMAMAPRAAAGADPAGEHFLWFSWHFSGYERCATWRALPNYIPMNFGEAPGYYRRFVEPPDGRLHQDLPDGRARVLQLRRRGYVHEGADERAKVLIVETCEAMPYVYGEQNAVHVPTSTT